MAHIASGRAFKRLERRTAKARPRLDPLAGETRQPAAPVGPPASGSLAGTDEPGVGIRGQVLADPMASLVPRGRVDDAGDVAARAKHEADFAVDQLRRRV